MKNFNPAEHEIIESSADEIGTVLQLILDHLGVSLARERYTREEKLILIRKERPLT